ncbi:hypothetical protein IAU59_001642 [Kwoniella sp. CBS 9459]
MSTHTYIPGAPTSSALAKPKRSKKKTTRTASDNGPGVSGGEATVDPDVIPGAAVAQAQAQAEESVTAIPSSLAAPGSISGETADVTPTAIAGESKEKGPVEEVIAKRMRQLGKKLQRFRGYASQPHDKLNADQKSAIASLPLLEGVYKELEDLTKQVEYVELEQAGKVREIKEQAKQEAEGVAASRVAESQFALSTPLGLFIRLHALLHPARSYDHEHLTFARLDLPPALQDEVQATDVLRVGRMHEDLVAGGERGAGVLAGLVRGPTEEDEDIDHVHHLLKLLGTAESYPADASAPEVEGSQGESAPEVEEPISTTASEHGLPNGYTAQDSPAAAPIAATGASTGALNFLQEDELADEESYEVVPHLEPHQTSGLQPPAETPVSVADPVAEPSTTRSDIPSPGAPAPGITPRQFDWAADEDLDDETEAAQIREAFAMAPSGAATPALPSTDGKTAESVEHTEEGDVTAIVQENELANAHVLQGAEGIAAPTAVDSIAPAPLPVKNVQVGGQEQDTPKRQQGRQGRGRGRQQSGRTQGQGQNKAEASTTVQGEGQAKGRGLPRVPSKATPSVDDDGFQVVGRQSSFSAGSPAQRGRGGGRGRGDGAGRGRGGQGQGQGQGGRGRGGAGPRNGQRTASGVDNSAQGAGGNAQNPSNAAPRPPRQNRQSQQAQVPAQNAPANSASA